MITETLGRAKMNYTAATLLSDLDRCPHGRHEGDTCYGWRGPGLYDGGCKGSVSLGNPLLKPGTVIGVDLYRMFVIRYPADRNDRHDPKAWYVPFDTYQKQYEAALANAVEQVLHG